MPQKVKDEVQGLGHVNKTKKSKYCRSWNAMNIIDAYSADASYNEYEEERQRRSPSITELTPSKHSIKRNGGDSCIIR